MPAGIKAAVIAIVLLVVTVIVWPFTIVGQGERTVVTRLGQVDRTLDPGFHWITPITESTHTFNVQVNTMSAESGAASKDLQSVQATVALTYNINPESIAAFYSNIRPDWEEYIISPALQNSIKAATAKYTAEELITKRDLVSDEILFTVKEGVLEKSKGDYFDISSIAITNFSFSEAFDQTIEAKVKAEQEALTAKNTLEKIKFEAEQTIATARAEAESIKLKSEAANNEKYVSLMKIEVQKKMAEKWNGVLPVNMYGSAPLPLLNVTQ